MNTVILYHANCLDGFGAAYAAWKHFGNSAEYIPVNYDEPVPDAAELADIIYLVDFSYKHDVLAALAENKSVTVIDHHTTAENELADLMINGTIDGIFDMKKSGAVLTWEWFTKAKVPELLKIIQDRDLWRFKYDDTKAITLALYSQKRYWYFHDFDILVSNWDEELPKLVKTGQLLLSIRGTKVNNIAKKSFLIEWGGVSVYIANCMPEYISDVAAVLDRLHKGTIFMGYYDIPGKRCFNLRSTVVDVSALAKKMGGGGHKAAAGFTIPLDICTILEEMR